jgi:hypothetical protein
MGPNVEVIEEIMKASIQIGKNLRLFSRRYSFDMKSL